MIGRKAETLLNHAVRYAIEHGHEYFTLEHVLWSLLGDHGIKDIISACSGNPLILRKALEAYLEKETPKTGSRLAQTPYSNVDNADVLSNPSAGGFSENPLEHPITTLGIQRLIQRALFHVQSAGKDEIQPVDLFVAFFQAKESHAYFLLSQQGIERLDVLTYISHGTIKDSNNDDEEGGAFTSGQFFPPEDEGGQNSRNSAKNSSRSFNEKDFQGGADGSEVNGDNLTGAATRGANGPTNGPDGMNENLSTFVIDLNVRAKEGKIDPLVGRDNELNRIIQILCRRRKNNPLLVGEAGVGKTALAEGLALRIVSGEVPDLLKNCVIYALDLGALLAGTKFRGDFEQRFKKVLAALTKAQAGLATGIQTPMSGPLPILLIDEIHTIIGAGAVSGGALDVANLLKPLLSRGELRCIGSTTYTEFRNVFEKDHALTRRFQKIDVTEPNLEETIQILNGLKSRFEEHHGVTYEQGAIRGAVELAMKHFSDRFLPDKAIDVIDEAGAKARLSNLPAPRLINIQAIEEIVAQMARIPARSVSVSQKSRLKNLERDLKLTIYGQDHAIGALVTSIQLARSGLRTGERPVGSFLFCGPTGVGKTELSKQLAHCLGVPFQRFDMSEYSEKHTISRLIGAPPGYVGFEQAGLLTDAVMKNPHCVVLLDEIEKAHADIWNILLQVMDHGNLTDNNGKKADFRNTILIMTSNVGSREAERRPLGISSGNDGDVQNHAAKKAVETTFSPEFRNRLDSVVYFHALDPVTVGRVVGKQLLELENQLLAKNVEIHVAADVREWLAHKGYDRQMGARPMGRLIQDKIKKPLAEEILFGKLENGGTVKALLKGEVSGENAEKSEIIFEFTSREPEPQIGPQITQGTQNAKPEEITEKVLESESASQQVSSKTHREG